MSLEKARCGRYTLLTCAVIFRLILDPKHSTRNRDLSHFAVAHELTVGCIFSIQVPPNNGPSEWA